MKETINRLKQKYRYSFIILNQLVITDFKLRYKGSFLGYLWTLLKPLFLFAILYVVFVHLLKIDDGTPHFAVYLLLGVVLWNYFVEVTSNGISAIVGKGDLMRKLYFPRYVVVIAGSVSALINLVINLIVVFVFMLINGVDFRWDGLLLIPLIAELFTFGLGVSFLLSALYVKFRDINYIWEVVLQAGFYATPIIYPISAVVTVSPFIAKLLLLNPVAQIIQDARWAVVTPQSLTIGNMFTHGYVRFFPIVLVIVLGVSAALYFRKKSPGFAEDI